MSNSNAFSAVLLGDLNDFIAPGQACINPIFVDDSKPGEDGKKKATIELSFDDIPKVTASKSLIKVDRTTKAAQVSLSDCLACSGCVTTAETVLLKQQSVSEFLSVMESIRQNSHPTFTVAAVTISPQVRASFAVRFGCSPIVAHAKIMDFLKTHCGVDVVLDAGALPSDISQLEVAHEFVRRFRQKQEQTSKKDSPMLPLLTSSCPGWVCYAEKTHAHTLPYLCGVKSPQQVSGLLVKRYLQQTKQLQPSQVYHVSIMQCPDKKLEGSRKEFRMGDDEVTSEVNCVLTATELCDAMLETITDSGDLDSLFRDRLNGAYNVTNELERTYGICTTGEEARSGSSGSLTAFVFRYAARELFGVTIPHDAPLPFKPGRNPDTWSLNLDINGSIVLRFSASYGFRNIQDVVRRIKNNTSQAHFIEVMACPGGCTNGGGLLLPAEKEATPANRKALSESVARAMEQIPWRSVENNTIAKEAIQANSDNLRTTFNAIQNLLANDLNPGW